MADKSIEQLNAAERVNSSDLFVLQQSGTAKKLTGQQLENWLVSLADGHGGIQSNVKVSTSGLVDTYRITYSDTTTFDYTITNGKSINRISKTGTSGLVDTYTIAYNNGTNSTFTVTNGAKGDKGNADHVYIKWASVANPGNTDMSDIPDAYIGVCTTTASSAPTTASSYKWYQYKGAKGDTGAAAVVTGSSVNYMVADSGTIVPSGSWESTVPNVPQGKYLWTRTRVTFNSGSTITSYSVTRMGLDGSGSVASVNEYSPDENGNVTVTASGIQTEDGYSVQSHLDNVDWTASVASNPNLIDNGWFLVDQRDSGDYTNAGYSLDRWFEGAGFTIHHHSNKNITLTSSKNIAQFSQRFETPLAPGTYTVSIKVTAMTGDWRFSVGDVAIDVSRGIWKRTFTLTEEKTFVSIWHLGTETGSITIAAVKIEHGSVSTLANDHAPDYAVELLKCQRYQYPIEFGAAHASAATGIAASASVIRCFVPTPTQMRSGAVIAYISGNVSGIRLDGAGQHLTPTAVSVSVVPMGLSLEFAVSGATANNVYKVTAGSGSNVKFLIESNL